MTVPALVVEKLTGAGIHQPTLAHSALASFLLIGPIEEFFKMFSVWVSVYRSEGFRQPEDGMLYAVSAALGFVSVENLVYLGLLGPEVLVSRTFFATPAHVLFALMWGYSIGIARFRNEGEMWTLAQGLVLAAGFHGAYDFLVAFHPRYAMYSLAPLLILMAGFCFFRLRAARSRNPFPPIGEGAVIVCSNCGAFTLEDEPLCARCGFEITPLPADIPRYCGICRAPIDPCKETCARCGKPARISRLCSSPS
jgi:hypothetical protein